MLEKQKKPFQRGYNSITEIDGKHGDMLLDFGILKMEEGDEYECSLPKERAFLLMEGKVEYLWLDKSETAERHSLLDEDPWTLQVPQSMAVKIRCLSSDAELCVERAINEESFEPVFYRPEDVRSDVFGAGTMQETSTRTVRTVFDAANAPWSQMVIGEVVNHPGKWSSYPPHDHAQPEIYHYRLFPSQGFGINILEEEADVVRNTDTALVTPNLVHSQTAAPGYAMYYIWMIPHLEGDKFGPDSRNFREEHKWLLDQDAVIWPDTE